MKRLKIARRHLKKAEEDMKREDARESLKMAKEGKRVDFIEKTLTVGSIT